MQQLWFWPTGNFEVCWFLNVQPYHQNYSNLYKNVFKMYKNVL